MICNALSNSIRPRTVMKPVDARRPLEWLGGQSVFDDLALQAGRLIELQKLLDQCAPLKGLQIKALDQTVLVVSAPSASIAAKFRQFEPSVLRTFSERGWKVSRIRVRPQLAADESPNRPSVVLQKPQIPSIGFDAMAGLLEKTEHPGLKEAIAHFLNKRP